MNSDSVTSIMELQARWDRIRVANIYDTLDRMGYGNQCLDLGIRPLLPTQHLAWMRRLSPERDPSTNDETEVEGNINIQSG